ncbi:MAG TPA: response regulator transcription factor [Abditibacterium sp.]|jgi:CheY-like chemotaxis protein
MPVKRVISPGHNIMELPEAPADNKYRILVVEDDQSISRLISIHLQKTGFHCFLAHDGSAGWDAFAECNPHLVLSDISMPGLSGHELIAKIRAISGVPLILMTAQATDENEMRGFKSGADDYVAKPFNPQLLVARVVANLRRVYRYSAPAPPEKAPSAKASPVKTPAAKAPDEASLPADWSRCDACGYMGPQFKFEGHDKKGDRIFVCPHCTNRSLTFSIG